MRRVIRETPAATDVLSPPITVRLSPWRLFLTHDACTPRGNSCSEARQTLSAPASSSSEKSTGAMWLSEANAPSLQIAHFAPLGVER